MIIHLGLTLHEQCNGCSGGCLVIFLGRMKSPIIEKTPVMNQQVFHGMVFSFVFSHLKLESGEIAIISKLLLPALWKSMIFVHNFWFILFGFAPYLHLLCVFGNSLGISLTSLEILVFSLSLSLFSK